MVIQAGFSVKRRRRMLCRAVVLAIGMISPIVLMAADGYGIKNPGWTLAPDAEKLLQEWGRIPYVRKNGRTDIFIRAQLKYRLDRTDYIHHWYDRPLLQDSSMGQRQEGLSGAVPWLNPESWAKTVEMGRIGKQAGFAVFTCTKQRDAVIPLSVRPGSEATILVELRRGSPVDEWMYRAGQALEMTNSYRFGDKVVLTSYPFVREKDLPRYAEIKRRLKERFGDRFLVMPYFNLFGDEVHGRSPLTAADVQRVRERLTRALRVLDGLCYVGRESYFNRRYDPWLFDHVITPIIQATFADAEFKDKILGCWATPGHENSYRWNYGLDCTGTRMLRDTLSSLVKLSPDFVLGCEWDEENENTCFRPMVSHGFTHQRLLRYFADTFNGHSLDVFPGDDTSVPNLVVSYRKEIMAGEPLEVEVLNIPDGTFKGIVFTLAFAWKTPGGKAVKTFAPQRLSSDILAAAWFDADASALIANPALVPELTVTASDGRKYVFSDGMWPVGLRPTRCIEYKWAKHPVRELPKGVTGTLALGEADADGVSRVKGRVSSPRRLRSVAVIDETDIVYMYDRARPSNVDMLTVRIAFQGYALSGKNHDLNGRISLMGAPRSVLSVSRSLGKVAVEGTDYVFTGATLNNWPQYLFVDIPKGEADRAIFKVDLPGCFSGEVSVKDILAKDVIGISGSKGRNLVFTRFLSQKSIPVPVNVNEAEFSFSLKPGLPRSILRLETVDEDYHVWRSRPMVCGVDSGRTVPFHVYERDADTVSCISVDESRMPYASYVFEPSRGSVVSCAGGRNLWGILGGCVPLVTGFGQGESAYGNSGIEGLSKQVLDWEKSAPDYVQEPDGSWALKFSGCSYLNLPQQLWPVAAGLDLSLEFNPDDVQRRQGLLITGPTSSSIYIEQGKVYARFFLRNLFFTRMSGHAATVVVPGPEVVAGRWQTVRVVHDQKTAHVEVDGVKGPEMPVSGDLFYPRYTALGAGASPNEYFAGRIRRFSAKVR